MVINMKSEQIYFNRFENVKLIIESLSIISTITISNYCVTIIQFHFNNLQFDVENIDVKAYKFETMYVLTKMAKEFYRGTLQSN